MRVGDVLLNEIQRLRIRTASENRDKDAWGGLAQNGYG